MKLVVAIVKPSKLDEVMAALTRLEVVGFTVDEVKGHGHEHGHTATYREAKYTVDLVTRIRIETVVSDSWVARTVSAITETAYSGEVGDGKVWVVPVEDVIRISSGETGSDALSS